MKKAQDQGSGSSYEVGSTAGPALEGVAAGDDSQDLTLARKLAAAGGAPGMREAEAAPFGSGSGEADLPPAGSNTWGEKAGQG